MWRDPGIPADSYYEVRPECAASVPQSKFRIKTGKTLSVRKWNAAFSPEGYLDISKILERIQHGGVHPSIRGEVWEFLLGSFDPNSTYEEREQTRENRRVKYEILKQLCKKMFSLIGSGRYVTAPIITDTGEPTQDPIAISQIYDVNTKTFVCQLNAGDIRDSPPDLQKQALEDGPMDKREIDWKLTLHQIGLDVVRTDRTLMFYEKEENLSRLWDILSVYAWLDADVGYCQGMSDLCSPIIMLLDNEADAFWCFERVMRKLRGNFRCTERSVGVESQLCNLATVTKVIDPKLHQHLETLGGGDYLFAVRMLMVLFRREFSFADSLYLWEMMWALEYDPDLFATYEDEGDGRDSNKGKAKSKRQCGKFERENMRNGTAAAPLPISVFLVASVLKEKSAKLQAEARGLDDVVKILNDITGNIDAKKACAGAVKLHKKYLKKVKAGDGGQKFSFFVAFAK